MTKEQTMDLNIENSIPIKALEQELYGCRSAIQCDMGSVYDRERIRAIKNILDWFKTPSYQERLSRCGFKPVTILTDTDSSFDIFLE